MGLNTLEDLYVEHLKDLYNAERQITDVLPRISKTAASPELKSVFNSHLQQTETQIERLEKVFQKLALIPYGNQSLGMAGLLQESEEVMSQEIATIYRDSALIGAVKKVEHYEVSAYETAVSYARLLGDEEAERFFTQTLAEKLQDEEELREIADGLAKWMGHIYWAPPQW
jgi:ferritin-like metal-binding protein YciE